MNNYVPVNKHTKTGRAGKKIKCPHCSTILRRVYHLNWTKLTCLSCQKNVSKYDWLIEESIYR